MHRICYSLQSRGGRFTESQEKKGGPARLFPLFSKLCTCSRLMLCECFAFLSYFDLSCAFLSCFGKGKRKGIGQVIC